jgi:hypothetical protein
MFVDLDGVLGVLPETVPVEQPVLARGLNSEGEGSSGAKPAVPTGATVRQATGVLLTSADGSLRVVAGKKSSSKDYIKHRCQAVIGMTVEQARAHPWLAEAVEGESNTPRYRLKGGCAYE